MVNLKTLSLIGWIGTFCTIESLWLSTQELFYFLIVKVLFYISNTYFANIANSQLVSMARPPLFLYAAADWDICATKGSRTKPSSSTQ
jgi:hypothetical protein